MKQYLPIILIFLLACAAHRKTAHTSWDNYIPRSFEDNQGIIHTEEFQAFQKLSAHEAIALDAALDTFATIKGSIARFLLADTALWDGEKHLEFRLRIDSTGHVYNVRFLNRIPINDTAAIRILFERMNAGKFRIPSHYRFAIEIKGIAERTVEGIVIMETGTPFFIEKKRMPDSIQKEVMRRVKRLRVAYGKKLQNSRNIGGRMDIRFIVREDGSVPKIGIIKSSLNNREFQEMVLGIIETWHFEPIMSTYDVCDVVYPSIFNK